MKKIVVINGPNLNLLGVRETSIYGRDTLKDVEKRLRKAATKHSYEIEFFQSNHEGDIIDYLQAILKIHQKNVSSCSLGIIINAGAFTHTSVGIRDALALLVPMIPFVEVHVSNIYKRESFRRHSYLSDIAVGVVAGLGTRGYDFALSYLVGN